MLDTRLAVAVVHQSRAVEGAGSSGAVPVGVADLVQRHRGSAADALLAGGIGIGDRPKGGEPEQHRQGQEGEQDEVASAHE